MGLIAGKYSIRDKLGEGFGGAVFLVESEGASLALKQLRMHAEQEYLSSEEILDNFKQEFTTLKRLNHPHILKILDFGYDRSENFHYFTTEYIRGQDLFEASRKLNAEQIEDLIVQTLRSLSYLHSQRIYHLDIKPSNILVSETADGKRIAKLIDFGLTAFRKKGFLAGSPAYLAPEALIGAPPDGRSDLYSLGVTWYKCLKGENPFEQPDTRQILQLQKSWMPPPISSQSTDIPPYLDSILEKLLRKNPAERYHHADQVIRDINWKGSRKYPLETEATALAYLPGEGRLVGRQREWAELIHRFEDVFAGASETHACVLLTGEAGVGKSRLLRELKYHAQLQNIPIVDLRTESLANLKPQGLMLWDDADLEDAKRAENLMRQFHRDPFMVLVAGRNLKAHFNNVTRISLGKFDRSQVREYIASVLGTDTPPDFLVDQIFARTEGNPLYLTELMQSLIQSHQIFDEQGRWSASLLREIGVDFSRLAFQPTLSDFCRAKYAHLSSSAKELLALLAVSKAPIYRLYLAKLGMPGHREVLEVLQEESLVTVDPVDGEIRLVNPSVRELVRSELDPASLARTHQTLGELLQSIKGQEDLAWFHMGFGQGSREARYRHLIRYSDALVSRLLPLEAIETLEVAAGIAPDQENRVDALLKKGRALFLAGNHQEALKLFEELQEILRRERKNPNHCKWVQQTYHEMCQIYLRAGRLDLAREALHVLQVLLDDYETEPVEQMILDNFRVSLLLREGRLKEAESIAAETHRHWEDLPLETKKLVSNNELAWILLAEKKAAEAKTLFQAEAAFYQAVGIISKRAYAIYGWAESCCRLKQFDEAARIYQFCVELSSDLKNEELLMHAYIGLGNVDFLQKNWARCIEQYQKALELAQRQSNASDSVMAIEINLGIAFRHLHDPTNAQLYLRHVTGLMEEQATLTHKQLQLLMSAYLELGRIYERCKDWVDARDSYRDALRMAKRYSAFRNIRVSGSLGLIRASLMLQRTKEAKALLNDLEREELSLFQNKRIEKTKELLFFSLADPESLESEVLKFKDSRNNALAIKEYF